MDQCHKLVCRSMPWHVPTTHRYINSKIFRKKKWGERENSEKSNYRVAWVLRSGGWTLACWPQLKRREAGRWAPDTSRASLQIIAWRAHSTQLTVYFSLLTTICSLLTDHWSVLRVQHSSLIAHWSLVHDRRFFWQSSAHWSIFSAHYSLFIAHCWLLTIHCSLLTAHYTHCTLLIVLTLVHIKLTH